MKNTHPIPAAPHAHAGLPELVKTRISSAWKHLLLALFALGLLAPLAHAQTTFKSVQIRDEVPTGFIGTIVLSNNVIKVPTNGASVLDGTGTNWVISPVTVSVTGAPSGVTASLTDSSGNPVTTIPVTMNTNNASQSTNLLLYLTFNGSQASGSTTLSLNANGALTNTFLLFTLEVGKIWNGPSQANINGSGNWSDASKWLGGIPGASDNVVFNDLGAQTNSLYGFGTASTNLQNNSIVDVSTTIASLRFGQTNGIGSPLTNYHNLFLNPGVTLNITGIDGFKWLRDYTFWSPKMNVLISGTNATMIVSNEVASFALLDDGATAAGPFGTLDMSRLSSLYVDVSQVNIGNIFQYPNYNNLITNGYTSGSNLGSSRPQKCEPYWFMAQTNYVRAVYADPFNYNNANLRNYALIIGRNELTGGNSGTDDQISMGYTNAFYLDGICIGGYGCLGASLNFQNTNSFALFRGTNGGRMSVFTCADAAGTASQNAGANTKCGNTGFGCDFTKGTVNALVDRFYMSRDRANATGAGVTQATFGMGAGIFDANSAVISDQESGNQTNQDSCTATLTITNTAVFRVNGTLALGYTTASLGNTALGSPSACNGSITIGPGGTVMASNITVGGVTKASVNNNISMLGNASLIVSNSLADATPNGSLSTLAMSGGNDSLTLFINGNNPHIPLVYVTNLTASGIGNKLIIGGVTNLTYPASVTLISGVGSPTISSASFDAGVAMPAGSGLSGTLVNSSSNTIDLQIINRTGNHLVWRAPVGGTGTANWDYTSKVWLDQVSGLMTNYENPDICSFDNTPGLATNINLVGGTPFSPGPVNMTNSTVYYTFTSAGGNSIIGGPALNKYGTGTLEVDGPTSFNVQLNQGALVGSGSLGGVSQASGTVMNYSGAIGGSVTSAGTGTSSGSIAGQLSILTGGVFTNSGSLANPFSVQTNGFLYNTASGSMGNVGVGTVGSPQVAAGGTFINYGTLGTFNLGNVLYVSGVFEDLGGGSDNITLYSVTIGAGGEFFPSAGTLGTTTINSDGTGGLTGFPGALLLVQGSTNVFELNPGGSPLNTVVNPNFLSFGGSASARSANGCTLQFVNVGASYAIGQRFQLFPFAPGNTGTSTNTYPSISPASPGNGMAWDLSQLWVNGSIGIISPVGPTLTSTSFVDGTGTNFVTTFSWNTGSPFVGYRLETLSAPLSLGLTSTNWGGVPGSWTNGWPMSITNTIGASIGATNCVFYRLSFP